MAISQNFPNTPPSLLLDFAKSKKLDSHITFTRGSTGTYVDDNGLIRTAGINEARFDHDPNTLKSLGLLLEESRTNLLVRSEEFDNASWSKVRTSISSNVAATLSPDGTNDSEKLIEDTSSTTDHFINLDATGSTSATYTASVFIKSAERYRIRFQIIASGAAGNRATAWFDSNTGSVVSTLAEGNGSVISTSIQQYPNGWYRCILTGIPSTAGNGTAVNFNITLNTTGTTTVYTGDGTSGIYIWGAQLEAGKEATSYIPTAGSTATRSIDVAYIDGTSFTNFYNQTEGTLFTSATYNGTPISGVRNRTSATIGGGVGFIWQIWWEGTSVLSTFGFNGSSYDLDMRGSSIAVNTSHKLITAYKTNDCAFCQDGGTVATDTSALINADKTTLRIGDIDGNNALNGRVSQLTYYPRRLSNTYLQELTK